MFIAILCMRVLEFLFLIGLVGSAIVAIISFIEDMKELIGKE